MTELWFECILAPTRTRNWAGERLGCVSLTGGEYFHKLTAKSTAMREGFPRQLQENRAPASTGYWLADVVLYAPCRPATISAHVQGAAEEQPQTVDTGNLNVAAEPHTFRLPFHPTGCAAIIYCRLIPMR